ncbi:MAG: T9SS type A sorting domain-containing protein [Bacteroidetes bacterium]|nr:T9SS type A sorting domain-containing protein [Bacteroidota bacterium]
MKRLLVLLIMAFWAMNVHAQVWDWAWVEDAGGTANEELGGQCVSDGPGNSYVIGSFSSPTVSFGTFTLTLTGTRNMFIAKYNSNGNVMWAKTSSACSDSRAFAVALDPTGHGLYVAGSYSGPSITFGTFTLSNTGNGCMYLVRYDNAGNVIWAHNAVNTNSSAAHGLAVDVWGNAYVTGEYQGPSITFGAATLNNLGLDSFDMFLVKYDSSGNVHWARNGGGNHIDGGNSVSIGKSGAGDVYITGYFGSPTATFGAQTLTNSTGNLNTFIVKYDSSGNAIWARKSIGNTGRNGSWVAAGIDPLEDVYVSGSFTGTNVKFDTATLVNANSSTLDAFLLQYDSSGTLKHAMRAGGTGDEIGGVTIDQNIVGKAFLTGYFTSDSFLVDTFAIHNTMHNNTSDIFVLGFDDQWNSFMAKTAGGAGDDIALSCSSHGIGDMYVAGSFTGQYSFFSSDTAENHAINGSGDIFVAKLTPVVTGVPQQKQENSEVTIFPNPAKQQFSISISNNQFGDLSIVDLFGRVVYSASLSKAKSVDMPVSLEAPAGMYLLRLSGSTATVCKKLLIE